MLNLLWRTTIEYIESICREEAPEWTKSLGLIPATILSGMIGVVGSPGDTLEMEMLIDLIQKTLHRLIATLETQFCGPEYEEDTGDKRPLKKFNKSYRNIDENM